MQKLRLEQTTKHKLTPQQIQFMNLLQVPITEMQQRIARELIENPALAKVAPESSEQEIQEEPVLDLETWSYTGGPKSKAHTISTEHLLNSQVAAGVSIQEELLKQLQLRALEDTDYLIAQHVIGSLTDTGYLPCTPAMLQAEIAFMYYKEVSLEKISAVVQQIQQLGPPGLAARDLQECLLLQLKRKPSTPTIQQAVQILTDHFEAFTKKHHTKLIEKLQVTPATLQAILQEITQLRPYPILPTPIQARKTTLEPDFMVTTHQGKITVALVEDKVSSMTIRRQYRELLQQHKKANNPESKALVAFIQDKINRAKWFMQAIKQRKQTLLHIMKAIVTLQRPFFETGNEKKLKPIFLRNVANHIGMDVSTVSRALSHKAVQTNWRIYPVRYFFSEPILTQAGIEVSSHVVKDLIKELITQEDKTKPHTDEVITAALQQQGYLIARRTVAKYRQQLGLPVARLRKELINLPSSVQ